MNKINKGDSVTLPTSKKAVRFQGDGRCEVVVKKTKSDTPAASTSGQITERKLVVQADLVHPTPSKDSQGDLNFVKCQDEAQDDVDFVKSMVQTSLPASAPTSATMTTDSNSSSTITEIPATKPGKRPSMKAAVKMAVKNKASLLAPKTQKTTGTFCMICGGRYYKIRDCPKFGRWVGCETCDSWVHAKCIGWEDHCVDDPTKLFVCLACQKLNSL